MKRTLIQLDEETHRRLKRQAFREERSLSAVVRDLIAKALDANAPARPTRVAQFSSVGAGRTKQGRLAPVSERHDEALAASRDDE